MTTAHPITKAPKKRSGVFKRQKTTKPKVNRTSGPAPNAVMRHSAPGNVVTHSATAVIQSMPIPISHQQGRSRPSGIASSQRIPHGITHPDTTGIAAKLAITP
jgi:hypothetical protein